MFFPCLLGAYFLSGFSALLYQILWIRQLTLAFGHSTLSLSAVLSAFMLGLTVGSIWGGKLAHRLSPQKAIVYFAIIEISLGVFSFLFRPLLNLLPNFLAVSLFNSVPLALLQVCYFLSSFVILSPLAVLMGFTFPLVTKAVLNQPEIRFPNPLGWLYGINTAGGVMGVLSATFLLLPHWGVSRSYYLAVTGNLLAAVFCFLSLKASPSLISKENGHVAMVHEFSFQAGGDTLEVHTFLATRWKGEPQETEEMRPAWFAQDAIPYDEMWPDDRYWLPLFLEGKFLRTRFLFGADDAVLEKEIREVAPAELT
jgi:predicted membrane-bound spermidine synthase